MKTRAFPIKRMLAVLAVLVLTFGTAYRAAAEETVFYESNFSKGQDGWYTWDPCQLYTKNKVLGIKGRQESWNSPRRDFPLEPGVTYYISVEVCQKQQQSAILMLIPYTIPVLLGQYIKQIGAHAA